MYTGTTLNEVIRIERLMSLHYFHYTQEFSYVGERHNFWEMVYIDEGEVGVVAETTGYNLDRGEAIFHKPNEYHNICTHSPFACAAIVSFETDSPAMTFFEEKIVKVTERQKYHIAEILREGKEALMDPLNIVEQETLVFSPEASFGTEQMIKTHVEQMLIDMIREDRALERGVCASDLVRKKNEGIVTAQIQDLLSERLASQITLDEIAAKIGFSKTYVKTLFKQSTGVSIMQMFNQMKIEEAKKLISQRNYLMTEISDVLGYSSVHYFSRAFKKATGMTPSAYSQSVRRRALL